MCWLQGRWNAKKIWCARLICTIYRRSHVWCLPFSMIMDRWWGIKEGVTSSEGQDRLHQAQVECSRQRYNLDRFSLLPVSCCVWETGFRIDNRTIKRGSRMSNSVTSFGESSNLCILASSYSVVIWSYPCEDIELVVISITSSCSSKSDLPFVSCCDFDLGGFSVSHQVRYLTLLYLILSHLVITNISTFYWEALVVLYPTQFESDQSELPFKSYDRLNIGYYSF